MIRADNGEYIIFGKGGEYLKYSTNGIPAPDCEQMTYCDKYGNELIRNDTDYMLTNRDGDSCILDQFDYCVLLNNNTLFVYKKHDPPTCQIIDCVDFDVIKDYGQNAKYTFNNGNLIINGVLIKHVHP